MRIGLYTIEKSNMDGSDRAVLVSQTTTKDLALPQSKDLERLLMIN